MERRLRSESCRAASGSVGPVSGSEYRGSDRSMENCVPIEDEPEIPATKVYGRSSRGRKVFKKSYAESQSEDDGRIGLEQAAEDEEELPQPKRGQRRPISVCEELETDNHRSTRLKKGRVADINGLPSTHDDCPRYPTRSHTTKALPSENDVSSRAARPRRGKKEEEDLYVDNPTSSGASADADGSFDDDPLHEESELDEDENAGGTVPGERESEPEDEGADGKPYSLRTRQRINYAIPPPLEEMRQPPPRRSKGRRNNGYGGGSHRPKWRSLGWNATGAELGRWMGIGGEDSDSDCVTKTPRKPPFTGFGAVGNGMVGGDLAAVGTPSNFGKINQGSLLADVDPLGVNVSVTFDEVGGLEEHIHSLKEMTLLPLLYPEVFQKFKVTPPRGVLFHGPPGTGKTLLARALATSCRSDSRSISFFMRKGADCLSKWVGEAERQLRLLFEEARASQPSIIFFDEIDGLAPVRSSKQDQIHASVVSTLLALMDGMDGRGQVVVIGATNRPDAVDPALRRPGRFDREFYFGLPALEAREKILAIMTKRWVGWGSTHELGSDVGQAEVQGDQQQEEGAEVNTDEEAVGDIEQKSEKASASASTVFINENLKGLARLTKGYGGADLRALCTEAALNAIQRRYPQIYQSNERLVLQHDTISVGMRDFMIAVKKIVPSSARSTSSAATPLPLQLEPLLSDAVDRVKAVISRIMPIEKPLTALEEAMFEDDGGEEGALEREMFSRSMQTLRIHRPRVVIHGAVGMGQNYVGGAVLHHLEGCHIQSLELGTLLSESTRTIEAAIVQLFMEAKRHQPSVIYIPSLVGWCAAVSETSRSTVRAMLDSLSPTDPVLVLAVVDGDFSELPPDVKAWFGPRRDNRILLPIPSKEQRHNFFAPLLQDIRRRPNQFSDCLKRKRRVLEKLPLAPPLQPRQPTTAELAVQEVNDQKIITLLKYRLVPILTELKRKFKRFTKRATEEYDFQMKAFIPEYVAAAPAVPSSPKGTLVNGFVHDADAGVPGPDGVVAVQQPASINELPNGITDITVHPHEELQRQQQQQMFARSQFPHMFDIDLEKMHSDLFKGHYLTPEDFLDDIGKMVHNADVCAKYDMDRFYKAQAMYTAAEVSVQDFDSQFRIECERMAVRERKRREEYRTLREKEKGKNKEDGQLANGVIRRSGRNNGQQPELPITDPVLLERKLKRQRSRETDALPQPQPQPCLEDDEKEEGEIEVDDSRDAKRVKVAGDSSNVEEDQGSQEVCGPAPERPLDGSPPSLMQIDPDPEVVSCDQSLSPMVVERRPSTPPPDFVVDEKLFEKVRSNLCEDTGSLTIEELEQLRATCLGYVWRRRMDWDRGLLLRKLLDVIHEYVSNISMEISQ